ncbi:MAG: S41 family peptidase [Armatimonadetes bacterium]|nr:S41 family peptidase [Armatimonadota bacterium]MBS1712085.1 S41 family peptidase [Armatimonadota bacterium]MBX3109361.1 S41 family peptidase [Fimbriimonadaceae bacterium]
MKAARITLTIALFGILFGLGFFARDVLAGNRPDFGAFGRLAAAPDKKTQNPVETFQANYGYILAKHGQNTTPEKLRYAAMGGLVASLGDPHTNFLEPKVNEKFNTETSGNYSGVGARLQQDPLGARIAVVFAGGPAGNAGIKEGDIITQVDGKNVAGKPVDDIVDHILGEAGTPVTLGIIRTGQDGIIQMPIVRQKVVIPTVESKNLEGNIAYISISGFSEPTPMQFEEAVRQADARNPAGMILDLRGNPGGLLESAVKMLSLFVDDKPAVTIKARDGKSATLKTNRGQAISGSYPITILINEDSASAAEIFSGVMRDYGKAKLIGTHSYGKASVQELRRVPDGASVKVTIARYFLPSSGDIGRKVDEDGAYLSGGLKPDIEADIPRDFEGFKFAEPGHDPQLDKALEFIRKNRLN